MTADAPVRPDIQLRRRRPWRGVDQTHRYQVARLGNREGELAVVADDYNAVDALVEKVEQHVGSDINVRALLLSAGDLDHEPGVGYGPVVSVTDHDRPGSRR